MKTDEKKSFVFYRSFYSIFSKLNFEQRGKLITAICEHVFAGGAETHLSKIVEVAFSGLVDTLDRDAEAYAERCRQNTENGRKGGRPRKAVAEEHTISRFSSPKSERFFEKAKKADNDNGDDNDNKNDNVNVNGDVNDNDAPCGGADAVSDLPHTQEREKIDFLEKKGAKIEASHSSGESLESLKKYGVPEDYAAERIDRARYYAARQKRTLESILKEWWEGDRQKPMPSQRIPSCHPQHSSSSFDTDEFFDLALKRSFPDKPQSLPFTDDGE